MTWAIVNGEPETGVTLHYIDAGIDTGAIIGVERFPILATDDAVSVGDKLKLAGIKLLRTWWPLVVSQRIRGTIQDDAQAKYYRLRVPDDSKIDWSAANTTIYNLVRALVRPWPGAFTPWNQQKVIVWKASPALSTTDTFPAGLIQAVEETGIRVATGQGDILLLEVEVNGISASGRALHELGFQPGDRFTELGVL